MSMFVCSLFALYMCFVLFLGVAYRLFPILDSETLISDIVFSDAQTTPMYDIFF